ncbi:MAG: cell division protein FtsZ [Bacteroidetes bacterium GWF2_33_38]|nr:MAG: cell division protein FtsZ [Bacteroidetes bacterium GWF2_33_38]OFY74284.1 MAG: cell division protein FtsZ [Bacteroidetes bacterium RIFOXYA12_FULL_33_9]
MNFEIPQQEASIIKVIGVGGGGGNAVNHMFKQGIKDVSFIIGNTDSQALAKSPIPIKIQLGQTLTEGRGAGNLPQKGKQAAIENLDEITNVLSNNTKMVFITAGMGGGTGTGAAPVIAKVAKDLGILTVGIVTIPFRFEGQRRINQAIEGISELKEHVDALLVINNERLREIYGDLKLADAFAKADNVLTTAAKGIAEIITVHGYINVDFADVQTVMKDSGVAMMGSGSADGDGRALKAIKTALTSPLLNNNDIRGAQNILLNVTSGSEEITMDEVGQITDYVQDAAGSMADIIWGNGYDESLGNKISVTIIATGFGTNSIPELKAKSETKKEIISPIKIEQKKEVIQKNETIFDFSKENTQQGTIQFEVRTIEEPIKESKTNIYEELYGEKKKEQKPESVDLDTKAEERKAQFEKYEKLRQLSHTKLTNNDLDELENISAFKRKQMETDLQEDSATNKYSRFTLSNDGEGGTKLSEGNPYTHDNVD